MPTTWVIAADASRARIFELQDRREPLRELEDFVHTASRAKDRDLITDSQGRYYGTDGSMGHSAPARTDPSEHEAEVFSRTVSAYVDKARTQHRFDQLCLIASPKFLGLMRQNLSKDAQRMIEREIPKNISWFNPRDLENYVREITAPRP